MKQNAHIEVQNKKENEIERLEEKLSSYTDDETKKKRLIKKACVSEDDLEQGYIKFDSKALKSSGPKEMREAFRKYQVLFETKNQYLIELVFRLNTKNANYGDYFLFILENILMDAEESNYRERAIIYDFESTFKLALETFKERFHEDFQEFFKKSNPIEPNNFASKEDKIQRKYEFDENFFTQGFHTTFLTTEIFSSEEKLDRFFGKLAYKTIHNKWLDAIQSFFDTCEIDLAKDLSFYIMTPLENEITTNFSCCTNQVDGESEDEENYDWLKHYYDNMHPLYKIRKLDQNSILAHKIVNLSVNKKWSNFVLYLYYAELMVYLVFIIFYTLNSSRLHKEYTYPVWFQWISLALAILVLFYETIEIFTIKLYYFYSFLNICEWINMLLCFMALFLSEKADTIGLKTSLYSFSIGFSYFCLIFRLEKTKMFGTYAYAFRKILIKSLRVLPIVLILFVGFYKAILIRSRFETNPDEEHSNNEIRVFRNNSIQGDGLIKLSLMFMGDIDMNDFGLYGNKSTINYVIIDSLIFLMPIFLFNLFIGIAVGEVTDILENGKYHLLKVRIDLILRTFYVLSFFKLFKLKLFRRFQHKKYMWSTRRNRKSWYYYVLKFMYHMNSKITNSTSDHRLKLKSESKLKKSDPNKVESYKETA